ncbi:MAG TPA: aspartyl protease family protein [Gemmataceae bacterium]|nr:aspartyl protease family protein [Gemmataceae bacterium]
MAPKGNNGMGIFSVEFQVANYGDLVLAERGQLAADQVRRKTISGIVDSGAVRLVLPEALAKELGLTLGDKINVRYADGRRVQRRQAKGVHVEIMGRQGAFTAIIEPKRETALVGALVLEDFDLLVDCKHQRLMPRNPDGPLYEIE